MDKPVTTELINELNRLALVLDGPEALIKWAVETIPDVVPCEFVSVALVRFDTALVSGGSVFEKGHKLSKKFGEMVCDEIVRQSGREMVFEEKMEQRRFNLPADGKKPSGAAIASFYIYPIKARDNFVGYVSIGSTEKDSFKKFRLNLMESFCDQLALGLRSLLEHSIVVEQARLLEEEKKRAEEVKRKMDAILGGMREGLILMDNQGSPIAVNNAAKNLIGLGGEYNIGAAKTFLSKMFSTDNAALPIAVRDIVMDGPERLVVRISKTPIRDDKWGSIGTAVLLTDVTKEKEAEQMKSDFVSAVSHELRTPLTSIREAVSLMADGITGSVNEKQTRCLSVALMDVDRLARIINDLLNLSRIESGKVRMKRTSVKVSELVSYVLASIQPQADKAQIKLVSKISNDLPEMFADPDQMIQVLTNLAGNAIKFTPAGGSVVVSAYRPQTTDHRLQTMDDKKGLQSVIISVSDTGAGISKDDQKKLFKKFSQLDTGLKRKAGGTGLGLAISKEIVDRHEGKIWVESEPPHGSSFKFAIPVFSQESSFLEVIQQEIDNAKETKGDLSVILIDPCFGKKPSKENQKVLSYLEEKTRASMRRRNDIVLRYRDRYIVTLVESDRDGAESLVQRIKDASQLKFKYAIAVYPEDGLKAGDIMRRIHEQI